MACRAAGRTSVLHDRIMSRGRRTAEFRRGGVFRFDPAAGQSVPRAGRRFCAKSDKRCADTGCTSDDSHPMSRHRRKEIRVEADEHQKNGLAIAVVVVAVLLVVAMIVVRAMAD